MTMYVDSSGSPIVSIGSQVGGQGEVGKEEEYTTSEIGSGVFSLGRGVDALTVDDSCLEPVEEV